MKDRFLNRSTLFTMVVVTAAVLAVSLVQRQQVAKSADVSQIKQKKLREMTVERDVEVEGVSESHSEYSTFDDLARDAMAIVYGRIIDSDSFFDQSGHPMEYGEIITTEYTIQIHRVLRDRTMKSIPSPDKLALAPLTTPLKIARNGGVVLVNGHRAAVKVKGYENLELGRDYIFFLFWSPDYKAYVLAGGISGAVIVNDDMSLKALATSKEIQASVRKLRLETLIEQIKQ
jgi:hypothetical protein